MERLTTNKDVSEMSMNELAFNSCYAKDGFARYRDFENDYDARDLARLLIKHYTGEDAPKDDEKFDEYIADDLQYGIFSTSGFIALFYRNLWAMAELREKLARYEDAEENGLLVRLPLKKGSKVYSAKEEYTVTEISCFDDFELKFIAKNDYSAIRFNVKEIGKTVFLTKAEAEAKLKEMEGEDEN